MGSYKKWTNHIYKLLLVLALLIAPMITYADDPGDLPCDGTDPYTQCPLDTWVIVLVIGAIILTLAHLSRKKKSLQA